MMGALKQLDYGELASAIAEWIRERVTIAGVDGVVLGLSGGIDSAVAAALAAKALGPDSVLGLVMPCANSEEDTADGIRTAEHLGACYSVIGLQDVLDSFIAAGSLDRSNTLVNANIKARLRMAMLYAHSAGRLVLGTSNYSEYMVGYWTKWGDGAADIQPIARLYKDEVVLLASALGLPDWVISRVPSAGLWPGQSDEGEMGVTYEEIRKYFEGSKIGDSAMMKIGQMVRSTDHKRKTIPFFDARTWMVENDE